MSPARIRVSVVVPTCLRPHLLRRCLAALSRQDLDPGSYEVLVVDDGASPDTSREVEALTSRLPPSRRGLRVRCLAGSPPRRGPAAARNLGWREARGEIIAFTDDDCIPHRRWLKAGLEAFTEGVAGVMGRLIMPLRRRSRDYERDAAGLEKGEFVTANCFYRRSALEEAGGFDERLRAAWREDSDLYFALLERNHRLVRASAAVVFHPVRAAAWGISLKQQRKMVFDALLYQKHPRLYRERIRRAPPWRYYATVAAVLAAAATAAGGFAGPALASAAVWGVLTGAFCARRLRDTSRDPIHVAEMAITSALIPPLAIYWRLRGALQFGVFFF